MMKIFGLCIIAGLAAGTQISNAGDITGTITFKGTPPAELPIPQIKENADCSKLHAEAVTTHHYMVGANGGLANVVVSLVGVPAKSGGATAAPAVMEQKGCEYVPMIMAVQTDQKVTVKNPDPVLHNVHTQPTVSGNEEKNQAQAPNGPDLNFTFSKPEAFLKFKCDVHPWMFAWVSVFDHPYFAVTDKDGSFKIANVPPGKYKLQAVHRKAGTVTQDIEVKEGAPTKADLSLSAK
jgi:plastocyanin